MRFSSSSRCAILRWYEFTIDRDHVLLELLPYHLSVRFFTTAEMSLHDKFQTKQKMVHILADAFVQCKILKYKPVRGNIIRMAFLRSRFAFSLPTRFDVQKEQLTSGWVMPLENMIGRFYIFSKLFIAL